MTATIEPETARTGHGGRDPLAFLADEHQGNRALTCWRLSSRQRSRVGVR